ncbi:pyrroline-5-carboxylate reductase [Haemophilus pittmaniae HK 85]|uniref:Pyrroline-5-carboxylate reductase n=2 Tax=Haemophilus pittmaniae TaxID=249188 RepID=F9Q6P5_9PAST|nr:pyrroline-5-carboxylate reductase [Haemophilus pittmaniae HK 85]
MGGNFNLRIQAGQIMQQRTITFIGGGNMAQAIILGLLKQGYPAALLGVSDPSAEKRAYFAALGLRTYTDNLSAVAEAEVVLLAVKPQVLTEVCAPFAALDFSQKLLISIAAGINTARLAQLIPSVQAIVRVMPNTPALVGEGMAGLFAATQTAQPDRDFAAELLSAVGDILWVKDEAQMHAVTAASGSSPAYFFLFLEAMQHNLIEQGLNAEEARHLVQQAMFGSAKMVLENPQLDLATLRQNVTSKGGTTAAALAVFEQQQFQQTVQQAMAACIARSQEMESQC